MAELIIGMGISGVLVVVIAALTLYSGINFACLANYTDLSACTINTMHQMGQDFRQANGATSISTNSITVSTDSGVPLTYLYSSSSRTLSRIQGTNSAVVLRECDSLKFFTYQRTPIQGTFTQYDIASTNEAKVVLVNWTCSRTIFGRKFSTDSTSLGRIVMRIN